MSGPESRRDLLILAGLLAAFLVYLIFFTDLSGLPAEDAAMLMRYARNLAGGYGIVWNIGEPAVDGATDFLTMVVIAGLMKLGIAAGSAVLGLGIVSQLSTLLIMYYVVRRVVEAPAWAAALSCLYLIAGPGMRYTEAYFGTAFFALAASACLALAYRFTYQKADKPAAAGFAICSLLMGLIRPEGVLLSFFILLAVVIRKGLGASRILILYSCLAFFTAGGTYFFWHWAYFGYPLPNPYYKKGAGTLHMGSLTASMLNAVQFVLPFTWIYFHGLFSALPHSFRKTFRSAPVLGEAARLLTGALLLGGSLLGLQIVFGSPSGYVRENYLPAILVLLGCTAAGGLWLILQPTVARSQTTKQAAERTEPADSPASEHARDYLFVVLPMLGFTAIWVLISDEMNFMGRFQYPVLIMVLMSWPLLVRSTLLQVTRQIAAAFGLWRGRVFGAAALVLGLSLLAYPFFTFRAQARSREEGLFAMAAFLQAYAGKGYTLAVTEAGILPYYSGWDAIDTWGLNDRWIAHNGIVTAEYLEERQPEIILYNSSRLFPEGVTLPGWEEMVDVLEQYALEHDYELAAVFPLTGRAHAHFYWVRRDFQDSQEIIETIRNFQYMWDGEKCPNVAEQVLD